MCVCVCVCAEVWVWMDETDCCEEKCDFGIYFATRSHVYRKWMQNAIYMIGIGIYGIAFFPHVGFIECVFGESSVLEWMKGYSIAYMNALDIW